MTENMVLKKYFLGRVFHSESDDDDDGDEHDIFKHKLAKALACIGIKPSTFHSLVVANKLDDVEKLVKKSMLQITEEFQSR